MALPSKLYRFKIELSDLEKSSYQSLDFRVAQHPSESLQFLLTRVFAYALNYQQDLEFTPGGLADPEGPCIRILNPHGGIQLWIEIGSPTARKIHRASKAADKVKIYTYKDPLPLLQEINSERIHRREELEIYSISGKFLEQLSAFVEKENRWNLIYTNGVIMVSSDTMSEQCELQRH